MWIDSACRQFHPSAVTSDSTAQAMWGYAHGNRTALAVVAVAIAVAAVAFVVRRVAHNRAQAKIWAARLEPVVEHTDGNSRNRRG